MKKLVLSLTIISFLFLSFGCSGGGSGGGESKNVSQVKILATFKSTFLSKMKTKKVHLGSNDGGMLMAANSLIQTIRYTVTGSGMEEIKGTAPVENDVVQISLMIPNGPQRHFVIETLDSTGTVTYIGSAVRDLNGQPQTIEITLEKFKAVTGLNAVAVSTNQIDLTWNAVEGNIQISGYKVYRDGLQIMTVTTTSASDTGLTQGTNYCYVVTAISTSGESQPSNQACATTISPVTITIDPNEVSVTDASDVAKWNTQFFTILLEDEKNYLADTEMEISFIWGVPKITGVVQLYDHNQPVNSPFQAYTDDVGQYILRVDFKSGDGLSYYGDIEVHHGDYSGSARLNVESPEVPPTVTGDWELHLKCEDEANDIAVLTVTLNQETGGEFSGSGNGFDYDGTPLHMELTGTYNNSTYLITSELTTTFTGSECIRTDIFSTILTSYDTGYITMTKTSACGGCIGQVRMIKK